MSRARIIAADTDANYLMSLQLKFAEEFFEKVDLEIITDESYFEELFSVPQKADILIVSEDLYNLSLQRHNIDHVFLMTEQYEEGSTEDLNVNKIYKYTSIKEIFNEITGKSSESLKGVGDEKREPQIILVTSASGGVGKTTVAMGLSACLTKNYKRVLYINTDWLQTFQHLLQNGASISSSDVYSKLMESKVNVYQEIKHLIRSEIFNYLSPFKTALISLGLSPDIFINIARMAKKSGDYDFVVIDSDSIFDNRKVKFIELADKVIFVTKQNKASVLATSLLVSSINGLSQEKYSYVCNDFEKEAENALISSNYSLNFIINEYIEHITHYDQLKGLDFAEFTSFQKTAYLFV